MITEITYDPERLELRVRFDDGRLAVHRGVPEAIHASLQASAERERFYMMHVRGLFPAA